MFKAGDRIYWGDLMCDVIFVDKKRYIIKAEHWPHGESLPKITVEIQFKLIHYV